MKEKLLRLSFFNVCFSAAFALFSVSFHLDVSVLAFPISILFTAAVFYFSHIKYFTKKNEKFAGATRELLQYLPFVQLVVFVLRRAGTHDTLFLIDLFSVLLWLAFFVISLFILRALKKELNKKTVRKGAKKIIFETLSWVDALVQAVFMVLLLNIFIVQLYEIPSESMVPEFLIKDRVVVFKTPSGPKFPLSNIGFPCIRKYNRGDIVVFRNPHYKTDRKAEVKTVTSQLLYMGTLTLVNINTDEDGNPKADPLVKRITGVPGEQLMMVDGVLYSRTADSNGEFKVVAEDATWAEYNLNNSKPAIKSQIAQFPLSPEQIEAMEKCEKERIALDLTSAAEECRELSRRFSAVARQFSNFETVVRGESEFFNEKALFEYSIFRDFEGQTAKFITTKGGTKCFEKLLCSWIDAFEKADSNTIGGNLYEDANFRLNIMIKLAFAHLVTRNAELMAQNASFEKKAGDKEITRAIESAEMLNQYAFLLDRRSMPIFPANNADGTPNFIPENCYFMMGDNRFNSLDMRHSYEEKLVPLSKLDPLSVTYLSNMEPQFVNRKSILGTTSFRFWPANRMGKPGKTGK